MIRKRIFDASAVIGLLAILTSLTVSCQNEFVPPPTGAEIAAANNPGGTPASSSGTYYSGSRTISGNGFEFRSGDRIGVGIHYGEGGKQIAKGVYRVDGDGQIHVPNVGSVGVGGLSAMNILPAIESSHRVKSNRSGLGGHATVYQINGVSVVLIKGQVRNPGVIGYSGASTIGAALSKAGGRIDAVSPTSSVVIHRNGIRSEYMLSNTSTMGVSVKAGDLIVVPRSF